MQFIGHRVRKIATTLIAGMMLVLAACGSSGNLSATISNSSKPVGTVQGVLTDASTNEPIAGAVIDIGVATATTNAHGEFTMTNVPANFDGQAQTGTAPAAGTYPMVIDMKGVTSPVNMTATGTTAPTVRYADIYLNQVLAVKFSSTNSAMVNNAGAGSSGQAASTSSSTIDNLAANVALKVGKLSVTITGEVGLASSLAPVGAGYTVELRSAAGVTSTGTGNTGDVIQSVTTAADGSFTFTNVEAGQNLTIRAYDSGYTMATAAPVAITSLMDGQTLHLPLQSAGASKILVASTDNAGPRLILTSPEAGADVPNTTTQVVFTFSEPIDANAYTNALTPGAATVAGLYKDVLVTSPGMKANEVIHSLSWSTDRTQLTVTLTTVASSTKYSINFNAAVTNASFVDRNKQAYDAANSLLSAGGNILAFTTTGTVSANAPTITATNATVLNNNTLSPVVVAVAPILDWRPVSGAKGYNVYRSTVTSLNGTAQATSASTLISGAVPIVPSTYTDATVAEYGVNGLAHSYKYCVSSVSFDNAESACSADLTAADVTKPVLATVVIAPAMALPAVGVTTTYTITLTLSEELNEAQALTLANYVVAKNVGAVATDIAPVLTAAAWSAATPNVVTLTATLTGSATATYSGAWTLSATAYDLSMNTRIPTYNNTGAVITNP